MKGPVKPGSPEDTLRDIWCFDHRAHHGKHIGETSDITPSTFDEQLEDLLFKFADYIKHHERTDLGGPNHQGTTKDSIKQLVAREVIEPAVLNESDFHRLLMAYAVKSEEEGALSPKVVTIRMDLAAHYYQLKESQRKALGIEQTNKEKL